MTRRSRLGWRHHPRALAAPAALLCTASLLSGCALLAATSPRSESRERSRVMTEMEDTDLGVDIESQSASEQRLAKARARPSRRAGSDSETEPAAASPTRPVERSSAAPDAAGDSDAVFDDILASPSRPSSPPSAEAGDKAAIAPPDSTDRSAQPAAPPAFAPDATPAAGSAGDADLPIPAQRSLQAPGRAPTDAPSRSPRLPEPLPGAAPEASPPPPLPVPLPLPEAAAPAARREEGSSDSAHVAVQSPDFGVVYDRRSRPRGLRAAPSQPPRDGVELAGGPATGADLSQSPMLANGASWDCPFPSEARRRGIDSAVVTLRVEVEADSRVENVIVLSDPGDGFAQQARRCALSKRWQAGRDRSGNAARRTTVVSIRFNRNG